MLPHNYNRYNGHRNRCEISGKELEDIEGVLQELIEELTVRTDKKRRGEGTRKKECQLTRESPTHIHRSTTRPTYHNANMQVQTTEMSGARGLPTGETESESEKECWGRQTREPPTHTHRSTIRTTYHNEPTVQVQATEMSRARRFPVGETEKTRVVAFPKWKDDMAPKYQPYDCIKANEDWEAMVVERRQIEANKQSQTRRSIPNRPFFFGTEEVANAANAAIKQINKSIKLVKNLQFAAGTLLPNANEQIIALDTISRELRDFHTLHHDMRIEARAPGAARPSTLFEKTPHPKNGPVDSSLCVCRQRCKRSQSSASVVTLESSIDVDVLTTVSSLYL